MIRFYAAMGGAALLAVVLGVLLIEQTRALHAARGEVGRLQGDLAACRAGSARLEASLATQSEAVTALKADGERRGRDLAQALEAAGREARTASARAGRIAAVEPRGADVCARLLDVDRKIMRAR